METLRQKEVLTLNELVTYTGLSKSYIYKLTHKRLIPHYKPTGKLLFFNLIEIKEWLQSKKVTTHTELKQQASNYLLTSKNK